MENSDAPGVRGEPGGHRASGRGRDSPDAHFFFADVTKVDIVWYTRITTYILINLRKLLVRSNPYSISSVSMSI